MENINFEDYNVYRAISTVFASFQQRNITSIAAKHD